MPLFCALLAVLALQSTAAEQPSPQELALRTTSLDLTVGIQGGIVGPIPRCRVLFGYDWNHRAFRVVQWGSVAPCDPTPHPMRGVDLEPDRYRDFLGCVLELGLDKLPLEYPQGCTDLYERDVGIRFIRGGKCWQNRAPGGCVSFTSRTAITPEQRLKFNAVIALVERTLEALPMEPASALDFWTPREWTALEICSMSTAVGALRGQGLADSLNLNGVQILNAGKPELTFHFPWRNAQPLSFYGGHPVEPSGACEVAIGPGPIAIGPVRVKGTRGETDADVERRRAFVAEHPELSAPHRDLILAGWVGSGMTEEMVIAAWGPPTQRRVEGKFVLMEFSRFDPAEAPLWSRTVTVVWSEGRMVMPMP